MKRIFGFSGKEENSEEVEKKTVQMRLNKNDMYASLHGREGGIGKTMREAEMDLGFKW